MPTPPAPASRLPDPLCRLADTHARTARHCQDLLQFARQDAGADRPALAGELIAWFDGPARQNQRRLDEALVPALLDSMAGSDAICIQGMAAGLRDTRRALDGRWHGVLRPALARLQAGEPAALDAALVQRWADDFTAHLRRADQELLAMAARLLSDAELEALAHSDAFHTPGGG